ncbi:MAG: aldo/keto reductase [Alphaproteobacteria bacterium]|nr:MAG: aldo/keto reductase [Alphaproteobacteria bacterium]
MRHGWCSPARCAELSLMKQNQLGPLWPVSELTLGGGGLGQIWGATSRDEAVATVHAALDAGITLLDMAPSYGRGEAEAVIGAAFDGHWPEGVRVTSKSILGSAPEAEMRERLEMSITRSLKVMQVEALDLFFLHSQIIPEDYELSEELKPLQERFCLTWPNYEGQFIPLMEEFKARGMIKDWGITGTGLPSCIMAALRHDVKPAAVQAITNLLDSPGGIRRYQEPPEPRNIIRTAVNNGVGVLGIRAVQAGALTDKIDRPMPVDDPEMLDYAKAAPYRALCAELKENPAVLAHRYALAMEGVDTVVLGVKNRQELQEIVEGVEKGPLDPEIVQAIDDLRLNFFPPKIPMEI